MKAKISPVFKITLSINQDIVVQLFDHSFIITPVIYKMQVKKCKKPCKNSYLAGLTCKNPANRLFYVNAEIPQNQ